MSLNQAQQFSALVDQAKHILIAFRRDGKGDAIASAAALTQYLIKKDKQIDVVCDGFTLPKKYSFIKRVNKISALPPHLQQFLVTVDVSEAGIQELSYDVQDGKLQIYITPKTGFLTHKNIRTAQSAFKYDLIIVLDSPDLESLGDLYTKHTELFYQVPLMNIDSQVSNERFGELNIVDVNASSTSEILARLLQEADQEVLDKKIATALLTGMIAATHSFKAENIKPQTLSLASTLVEMGADRDYIIKKLYQTKSLEMLRLWGKALSEMKFDESMGLVSTMITYQDFKTAGASEEELYEIIDELIANSPDEKMTLLLHEEHADDGIVIHAILHAERGLDAAALLASFDATGNEQQASAKLHNMTLQEAERAIVTTIREQL